MINYNAALPAMALSGRRGIDVNQWINDVKGNLTALARSMFARGEQGFAYDPNDLSTMFQDVAGTIPVTSAGQPVGLILDKSKGLVLGSNIVPNVSFSSDTSWNKGPGWAIADGVARFDGSATYSNLGNITPSSINGKWLRVELDLSNVGASVTQVRILVSGGLAATIPVSGAGKYSAMILGGSVPSIGIQSQGASGANYAFTLDNVSFKEAFGNHAYQTTSAARPILRKNAVTGANYLEFDGTDDFLVTNNIDFTATDKVSLFAGVKTVSNSATGSVVESGLSYVNPLGGFAIRNPITSGSEYGGLYTSASISGTQSIRAIIGNNPTVIAGTIDFSKDTLAEQIALRVNGVKSPDAATGVLGQGVFGNVPIYVGSRAGTLQRINGHLYSLIGIGRLTSDSETAAIEKEIAKRVGVTLNV